MLKQKKFRQNLKKQKKKCALNRKKKSFVKKNQLVILMLFVFFVLFLFYYYVDEMCCVRIECDRNKKVVVTMKFIPTLGGMLSVLSVDWVVCEIINKAKKYEIYVHCKALVKDKPLGLMTRICTLWLLIGSKPNQTLSKII